MSAWDFAYLIYCLVIAALAVGAVLASRNASKSEGRRGDPAWWIATVGSSVLAAPVALFACFVLFVLAKAFVRNSGLGSSDGMGVPPGALYSFFYLSIVGIPCTVATATLMFVAPEDFTHGTRRRLRGVSVALGLAVMIGWVLIRVYCLPV